MVDIRMPDGAVVRFPDELTDHQIRGLILRKYPHAIEAHAAVENGVDEHYASGDRGMAGAVVDVGVAEDAGPFDAAERGTLSIGESPTDDPYQLYEFLVRRGVEDPNRLEARSGYRPDAAGQTEQLSEIDRAKLVTALIKANGGKPLR